MGQKSLQNLLKGTPTYLGCYIIVTCLDYIKLHYT